MALQHGGHNTFEGGHGLVLQMAFHELKEASKH